LAHEAFHEETRLRPQLYLHKDPDLKPFLQRLVAGNKKVFLITNSPFETVNVGMIYMVGSDWRDFFDVIIVKGRKPHFFTNNSQPFRQLNLDRGVNQWDKVSSLRKGLIYVGGTIDQLQKITGWRGGMVMYFGDHPYADLADVTLRHGWRTAAIIRELEHEIDTMNTEQFKWEVNWQQMLKALIEENQGNEEPDALEVLDAWSEELEKGRVRLKEMFNPQFGSAFRSSNNPTYFSRRLFRFADLYTPRLTNLLKYSLNHKFYPRRGALPHEYKSWFV